MPTLVWTCKGNMGWHNFLCQHRLWWEYCCEEGTLEVNQWTPTVISDFSVVLTECVLPHSLPRHKQQTHSLWHLVRVINTAKVTHNGWLCTNKYSRVGNQIASSADATICLRLLAFQCRMKDTTYCGTIQKFKGISASEITLIRHQMNCRWGVYYRLDKVIIANSLAVTRSPTWPLENISTQYACVPDCYIYQEGEVVMYKIVHTYKHFKYYFASLLSVVDYKFNWEVTTGLTYYFRLHSHSRCWLVRFKGQGGYLQISIDGLIIVVCVWGEQAAVEYAYIQKHHFSVVSALSVPLITVKNKMDQWARTEGHPISQHMLLS